MECSVCHTPLNGDLDTFGDVHQPLCRECFFTADPEGDAELEELEAELDDLEGDLIEAQDRVDELEGDISDVRDRIKQFKLGKRHGKSDEQAKLQKWAQAVAA